MHGLAVYVKELEHSADSYLCFRLALLLSVLYFIFLYCSLSSSLCTVFNSISSNIDEVLSINPSANVFVFENFNIHHKDWLTFSGRTDRSGEFFYNFSISIYLTQMVNFPTRIPGYDSHSPALLDFVPSSDNVLQLPSLHWEILVILLSPFPLIFHHIHNGCLVSSHSL